MEWTRGLCRKELRESGSSILQLKERSEEVIKFLMANENTWLGYGRHTEGKELRNVPDKSNGIEASSTLSLNITVTGDSHLNIFGFLLGSYKWAWLF